MDKTHAATAVDQTINYENKKGNNRRMNGKIKKTTSKMAQNFSTAVSTWFHCSNVYSIASNMLEFRW